VSVDSTSPELMVEVKKKAKKKNLVCRHLMFKDEKKKNCSNDHLESN